ISSRELRVAHRGSVTGEGYPDVLLRLKVRGPLHLVGSSCSSGPRADQVAVFKAKGERCKM
ncbi:MAG: hypothetical protein MK312_03410, partial [Roseibacillus sp.]|nr:hypothetical protein [Roseibacillus sp.]